MAAIVAAASERRRRGLQSVWQFTLRDALVATTLTAVLLSWPSLRDFWNREEIQSVQRLRAAGHGIAVEPRRPDWFWELCSVDRHQTMNADCLHPIIYSHRDSLRLTAAEAALLERLDLSAISLANAPLDDGSLPFLRKMTGLRSANFAITALTDDGLAALRAARGLNYLEVGSCRIGDGGLRYVADMTGLWELDLWDTSVTDAGLGHLRSLQELQRINVGATEVTDAGMAHVAALRNLESVYLHQTSIGDEGVAILVTLPKLRRLEMGKTRVTDEGLEHLSRAKYLVSLNLANTGITDAGLSHLARLDCLELVYLVNCPGCTPQGVARLRQARPILQVIWTTTE